MVYRFNRIVSCVLSAVVIVINTYFVVSYVTTHFLDDASPWLIYTSLAIFGALYLAFCLYLILHVAMSMGATFVFRFSVGTTNSSFNFNQLQFHLTLTYSSFQFLRKMFPLSRREPSVLLSSSSENYGYDGNNE